MEIEDMAYLNFRNRINNSPATDGARSFSGRGCLLCLKKRGVLTPVSSKISFSGDLLDAGSFSMQS